MNDGQALWDAVRAIGVSLFERGSPLETWGLVAVFFMVTIAVYKLVAKAFGLPSRAILVLVPGFFILLLSMAAVQVFWTADLRFQLAVAGVVFFVVVIPLSNVLQGSSWFSSLILWGVTLSAAAAIFYAESAISGAVRQGAGSGSRYKQRHEQVNEFMDQAE